MKKIICVLLSIIMSLSVFLFPLTALATEGFTVYCHDYVASSGDFIQVPIVISGNPGIISIKVKITYDDTLLTLENAQGDAFQGVSFGPLDANPFTVNWIDSLHGNNTTDGNLVILTFRVNEGVEKGYTDILLEVDQNDVFNNDLQPCHFMLVKGGVTIQGETQDPSTPTDIPTDTNIPTPSDTPTPTEPDLGDINGDKTINAKDALVALKYAVGKCVLTPQEVILADVNKDNFVNAKDALEILKYAVGKPSCLAK